jgi:hypothetical protein
MGTKTVRHIFVARPLLEHSSKRRALQATRANAARTTTVDRSEDQFLNRFWPHAPGKYQWNQPHVNKITADGAVPRQTRSSRSSRPCGSINHCCNVTAPVRAKALPQDLRRCEGDDARVKFPENAEVQ